jgi:hypothetical protein
VSALIGRSSTFLRVSLFVSTKATVNRCNEPPTQPTNQPTNHATKPNQTKPNQTTQQRTQNSCWTGSAGTCSSTRPCSKRPTARRRKWQPMYVRASHVEFVVCVWIYLYVCGDGHPLNVLERSLPYVPMNRRTPTHPSKHTNTIPYIYIYRSNHAQNTQKQVEEGLSRMDCHALAHGNLEAR